MSVWSTQRVKALRPWLIKMFKAHCNLTGGSFAYCGLLFSKSQSWILIKTPACIVRPRVMVESRFGRNFEQTLDKWSWLGSVCLISQTFQMCSDLKGDFEVFLFLWFEIKTRSLASLPVANSVIKESGSFSKALRRTGEGPSPRVRCSTGMLSSWAHLPSTVRQS